MNNIYKIFLLTGSVLITTASFAQVDTIKKKSVDITSSYKPVLRNAVKINFNASPAPVDSSRPRLNYAIPAQNLVFRYQPVSLRPLALSIDSGGNWPMKNYVKIGFGNFQAPFAEAGFSFGDGSKSQLSVFVHHLSQKGKLKFQQFSQTGGNLAGALRSGNLEYTGKLGFEQQQNYYYGYLPTTLSFSKDSVKQSFQTISGRIGLRNVNPTEFGLLFHPNLKIDIFTDKFKASESNTVLDVPLEKTIGKTFGIKLGLTADLTRYKPRTGNAINNNLFYISPALLFKTPNVYVHGGILPAWDNNKFYMMPNIMVDFKLSEDKFILQAGWIGYYNKTTYQRLAGQNPWVAQPSSLLNTRVQERYAGFKGSAGSHIVYNAKVGYIQYDNMPLFVNDTVDGKTFNVVNESQLQVLQLHGEVGIIEKEIFSLHAGFNFNQFAKKATQAEAWGILPVELNASLRWQLIKDLWLKSDVFAWDGAKYRTKSGLAAKNNGAFDLNAGLEFRITKNLNLWAQFNNLLNNRYQRWNQYEVLGFNVLGGIVFNFAQQKK